MRKLCILSLFLIFSEGGLFAQLGDCGNIDFEDGNFNGWTGFRGYNPDAPGGYTNPYAGPNGSCCTPMIPSPIDAPLQDTASRHTIMSAAGGNDFYGGFPVIPPPVPGSGAPAGNYSVRIGNDRHLIDSGGWTMDMLEFTYTPTAANNIFTYQYAVVLNSQPNEPTHEDKSGPWFEMLVLNPQGDTVECTYQFQTANPAGAVQLPDGYIQSTVARPGQNGDVVYKPWSTVSFDFIAHVGTPLTIRFTVADCHLGGHFGYAYFNCECWQIKVTGKDTICEGETSTLIAPDEENATYDWTGPGGHYTGQTIEVNQTGVYEVSITDPQGCIKKADYEVYVNQKPTANFTQNIVCVGNPVSFTDNSSVPDPALNPIVSWDWDFGDGAGTSSSKNPSYTYPSQGTYNAQLIVTTKWGCIDTVLIPVTVQPPPVAIFSGVDVCQGEPTCFTNASTVPSGSIIRHEVDYGDGTTSSNISNFCHTYNTAGNFDVTLTVTSDLGCKHDTTITVEVYPFPKADFNVDPMITDIFDPNFTITDVSSGAETGTWDLGDGTDSNYAKGGQVIEHTYYAENVPGGYTYTITLDVISDNGCPNTVTKTIRITPYWTFYIPNAFTPNGDLINDTFFAKGEGILEFEMWIFDRWGNRIFHCDVDDLPQHDLCHWDGVHMNGSSGLVAQQDVYVWLVNFTDIFGDKHRRIGHVSMVR